MCSITYQWLVAAETPQASPILKCNRVYNICPVVHCDAHPSVFTQASRRECILQPLADYFGSMVLWKTCRLQASALKCLLLINVVNGEAHIWFRCMAVPQVGGSDKVFHRISQNFQFSMAIVLKLRQSNLRKIFSAWGFVPAIQHFISLHCPPLHCGHHIFR